MQLGLDNLKKSAQPWAWSEQYTQGEGPGLRYIAVARAEDCTLLASHLASLHASTALRSQMHDAILDMLRRIRNARSMLKKADKSGGGATQVPTGRGARPAPMADGMFQYEVNEILIVVLLTDSDYPQRLAFQCIGRLQKLFLHTFNDSIKTAKQATPDNSQPAHAAYAE